MTCPMIQCTRKFSSTSTKEEFFIYCTVTCKTENIIYLLECGICGLQYVGQTRRQLRLRLNNHRSNAKLKLPCSLSRHLSSRGHNNSFDDLKVTIIEHNPDWDVKSRREWESFWIEKLKTLSPNGINKNN